MKNEEFFSYNQTLSKERIEELLDLAISVNSLKDKFETISIDTSKLKKVIKEMEDNDYDEDIVNQLKDYEEYVMDHGNKLEEFNDALEEF